MGGSLLVGFRAGYHALRHTGNGARNGNTEDAGWYAPFRRCTSLPAASILDASGLAKSLRHCADPYNAGSTRRNQPTEAWYRSPSLPGLRSRDRWSPPSLLMAAKRGFAIVGGHVAFHIGQLQRKLIFRKRHIATLITVNDRDRLAPVTLSGKYPVTQLIVRFRCANAVLFRDIPMIASFASATSMPFKKPEFTSFPVATSAKAASFTSTGPSELSTT